MSKISKNKTRVFSLLIMTALILCSAVGSIAYATKYDKAKAWNSGSFYIAVYKNKTKWYQSTISLSNPKTSKNKTPKADYDEHGKQSLKWTTKPTRTL